VSGNTHDGPRIEDLGEEEVIKPCLGCGTLADPLEPCPACGRAPPDDRLGDMVASRYRSSRCSARAAWGGSTARCTSSSASPWR
jgi:hypothetical protein